MSYSYEALASTFPGYGGADQPYAHAQADLCLRYPRHDVERATVSL